MDLVRTRSLDGTTCGRYLLILYVGDGHIIGRAFLFLFLAPTPIRIYYSLPFDSDNAIDGEFYVLTYIFGIKNIQIVIIPCKIMIYTETTNFDI